MVDGLSFLPGAASGPIRGLIWLAETLQEQAEVELEEREYAARHALEAAEAAHAAGEISDEEIARIEDEYAQQVLQAPTAGEAAQQSSTNGQ